MNILIFQGHLRYLITVIYHFSISLKEKFIAHLMEVIIQNDHWRFRIAIFLSYFESLNLQNSLGFEFLNLILYFRISCRILQFPIFSQINNSYFLSTRSAQDFEYSSLLVPKLPQNQASVIIPTILYPILAS